jgi:hypothetical protein
MKNISALTYKQSGLDKKDFAFLKRLTTPQKIQEYLNKLPFNFEKNGETYMSPKRALEVGKIHCFEGALLAAAALWIQGQPPLLLDLKADKIDVDHVVVPFCVDGWWGALSKTNHGVLRYREPIYKNIRELAMSYFHEYFLFDGTKTMRSFSKPFDLSKKGYGWITAEKELFDLVDELDESPHIEILSIKQKRNLRKADPTERDMGQITEWKT